MGSPEADRPHPPTVQLLAPVPSYHLDLHWQVLVAVADVAITLVPSVGAVESYQ